jgi:hypothetical protein
MSLALFASVAAALYVLVFVLFARGAARQNSAYDQSLSGGAQ